MQFIKALLIILFPLFLQAQKTNEPTIVYPLLEQFIAEAYNRDIPVYHKIQDIDSISSVLLNYPITGIHIRQGRKHWIMIHKNREGRQLEKTFYHEVGHVFGLKHSDNPNTIMFSGSYSEWLENEKNWQKAKDEYFKLLKINVWN